MPFSDSRTTATHHPPDARTIGTHFENRAAQWCHDRGWTVIARNVRCRRGEIDIIALDGTTLVFLEVRYRRSVRYGSAVESVTPAKLQSLTAAIRYWLNSREGRLYARRAMRCDLLAYCGTQPEPQWIPNAFTPSPW
ncbi:YraN family protein [Hydrogenophilus thiooxidans]|uniref:YraN family protein n=1 Tax=Hydrogenophilus thiooxidans TaxID=2820326 RepID=UPI001C21B4E2|nr:YraN family protein [Hydrogenophilus thiooxidans]